MRSCRELTTLLLAVAVGASVMGVLQTEEAHGDLLYTGAGGTFEWSQYDWYLDEDLTEPAAAPPGAGDTAYVLNPGQTDSLNTDIILDVDVTVGSLMWLNEQGSSGRELKGTGTLTFDAAGGTSLWRISGRNDGGFVLRNGDILPPIVLDNDLRIEWADHERDEEFFSLLSGVGKLTLDPTEKRDINQGFYFGRTDGPANTHSGGTELVWSDDTPFTLRKDNAFGTGVLTINENTHADFVIDLNGTSQTVSGAMAWGTTLNPGTYTQNDLDWLSGEGELVVIPEPATWLLLIPTLMCGLLMRRRP